MKLLNLIEAQELNFEEYINKLPKEIVEKLKVTEQNPIYHSEGNAYVHTKNVFNQAKKYGKDFAIAAIFHDLGKIDTHTIDEFGKIHHYKHEEKSMDYLDKYLYLFPYENKDLIYEIVRQHMRIDKLPEMKLSKQKTFKENPFFKQIQIFNKLDKNREE